MTAKSKFAPNPLYGKFDEIVDAIVDSPQAVKGIKVKAHQPTSPPAHIKRKTKHVR